MKTSPSLETSGKRDLIEDLSNANEDDKNVGTAERHPENEVFSKVKKERMPFSSGCGHKSPDKESCKIYSQPRMDKKLLNNSYNPKTQK